MGINLRIGGVPTRTEEQIYKENVKILDISQINVKSNVRIDYDELELNDLKESIRKDGLLQPIVVVRNKEEDGMYFVLTGHRRFLSFKSLHEEDNTKFSKIPAILYNSIDEVKTIEIQLIENIQRSNLKPLELAQALKDLKDKTNATNEYIGKSLGKTEKWVRDNIKAIEIIENTNIDVNVANERFTVTNILETKGLEVNQQKELLEEMAATSLTAQEVRTIKNEIKNNPGTDIKEEVQKIKINSPDVNVVEKQNNFVKVKLENKTITLKKKPIKNIDSIIELIDENIEYIELKDYIIKLLSTVNN